MTIRHLPEAVFATTQTIASISMPGAGVQDTGVPLPEQEWVVGFLLISMGILLGLAALTALVAIGARLKNQRVARRMNEAEGRWIPRILEALDDPAQVEDVRMAVPPAEREIFLTLLLRFATRVKGAERARAEALAQPHLEVMLRRLRSRRPEDRARSIRVLGTLAGGSQQATLMEALDDPAPVVAMTAARVLLPSGDPAVTQRFLDRLERFSGWSRGLLASTLASGGSGAVPALRSILEDDDQSAWVRAVAADALRELDDPGAVETAGRVATSSEDRDLRVACLALLSHAGSRGDLPVVRSLVSDDDFAVRAAALTALGRLGTPEDRPILASALADDSPWVAIRAGIALHEAGGQDLLRSLQSEDGAHGLVARQVMTERGVS